MTMRRFQFLVVTVVVLLLLSPELSGQARTTVPLPDDDPAKTAQSPHDAAKAGSDPSPALPELAWKQTANIKGIKVDFRVAPSLKDTILHQGPVPVSLNDVTGQEMFEGQQAYVQFRLTDAAGAPLSGLSVAAWLDQNRTGKPAEKNVCHDKIQSFLQLMLSARPDVDLNTYYILALTREPNILVIDPRLGFGTSKLYAMIDLPAPGADWALSGNRQRVFVSMPAAHKVAAVDGLTFRTTASLEVGENPVRLALQPDGKYLWIGNDAVQNPSESGVTVLNVEDLNIAARIPTGRGHHEIVFDDGHNAYVTNSQEGTVSVVSIENLAKVKDVSVGREPVALAYSTRSKAVYVAARGDGKIAIISAEDQNVVGTLAGRPGLSALKISPDGRWGFAANDKENNVLQFDVSTNKVRQAYAVGRSPDQLAFTAAYLYVRSRESDEVKLIPLSAEGQGNIAEFPAGQVAPGKLADSPAPAIIPSLDNGGAFVVNAADRRIYYYQEGMAAPMGSMEGYGKTPLSVMVLDRSIHETSPGIYSVGLRLPKPGFYDVPLFVDSPTLSYCFDFTVRVNPLLKKDHLDPVSLRALKNNFQVKPGEPAQVQFRLTDPETGQPRDGLKDVQVTVLLADGLRQLHFFADPLPDGIYQFTFAPPKAGVYYGMVSIPSLKMRANRLPYLMVRAVESQTSEVQPPEKRDAEPTKKQ
jgi:YVTN family beta-propeller protein